MAQATVPQQVGSDKPAIVRYFWGGGYKPQPVAEANDPFEQWRYVTEKVKRNNNIVGSEAKRLLASSEPASFAKIEALELWHEKYGREAPSAKTITTAKSWLRGLYCDAVTAKTWTEPNVTASADADVVFEWWNGDKKLTIYVSEQGIEYIKVWGLDIFNEMEDGNAQDNTTRQKLWSWLIG